MRILAVDPGTKDSGWVRFDCPSRRVVDAGVIDNAALVAWLASSDVQLTGWTLAIEKIEAMGMAVGAEVFETVHWSGRFYQAWREPSPVQRVTRRQVKLHLCGSMKAKDPHIRQAVIDILGAPGSKKNPGPTYGVTSHAWAALAVAVTVAGLYPPVESRAPAQEATA